MKLRNVIKVAACGLLAAAVHSGASAQVSDGTDESDMYFSAAAPQGAKDEGLSKAQAGTFYAQLVQDWEKKAKEHYASAYKNKVVTHGDVQMKYKVKVFGDEPEDGRSLWISLHGGGGTTKDVNDQQWDNQIKLYEPDEGVYIAPRAPWDAWNMWFQEPIDHLFEDLITMCEVYYNVNPNKVYLLGYSAGGDGVWRLAPRLADHWAAASMMAGHPGDVSLVNLRNCPFMIWCGANDNAYNRNVECKKRGEVMDQLWEHDKYGYKHETHIVPGKGHWMDGLDAAALSWMTEFDNRNPYPSKVVWKQEEVLENDFYWLAVPKSEMARGKTLVASYKDNTVKIIKCDYTKIVIMLDDQMMDLDQPVKVVYGDKTLFDGKVLRTRDNMVRTLMARGDVSYVFPAILNVDVK